MTSLKILLDLFLISIKLRRNCQIVAVQVEKTIVLDSTKPEATIEYVFQNQSYQIIEFLFKHHAAIAIQEKDEILLPNCLIEPAVLEFSKIIGRQEKTHFPKALAADSTAVDLRYTPPRTSKLQEFYYSFNLAVGQCGIYNRRSQSSLVMSFDKADFPYVWVFQSYGGWQDYYVLVLEPCTNIPYDLEVTCRNGTAAQL